MPAMKSILAPLVLAATASAHAIFQQLYVNGVTPGHLVAIRAPDYEGVSILLLARARGILSTTRSRSST
jgi:hypothetical protein